MEHLTFHSLYIIHYSTPSYNQECKAFLIKGYSVHVARPFLLMWEGSLPA